MDSESLKTMIKARDSLNIDFCKEEEYKKIYDSIQKYIHDKCIHDFIFDWVDTDYECSIQIKYCQKCFTTLSN
jgi:hypothetical protein